MDKETVYQNIHQDIIDGCVDGDQKSQFKIYKLYYKAMYNASLRIVNDSMEAEDIMQDAFLAAFEKIDTYGGKVSFGAWLKKIVINKSLDNIKKKELNLYHLKSRNTGLKKRAVMKNQESRKFPLKILKIA